MSERQPPRQLDSEFTTAVFTRVGLDRYAEFPSLLGSAFVGWSGRGVCGVRLATVPDAEAWFVEWYRERTGRRVVRAVELDAIARAARRRLADPTAPDVPLDTDGATPLERAVLATVAHIRFGYARPYELIARELDEPCASETVADVLARNAVPLVVACHRVVPADRCCSTQYVLGAQAQRRLLAAEGLDAAAVDRVIARGFRYIENDGWFCLPTCGDIAARIDLPGYAGLRSLSEAHAHGLRPCESCRPVPIAA
jgi:O-6-methylguanine DNA methyltransferase